MAWGHFWMALVWSTEYICSLNRMSRIMDRENLPKCMGFVLSFYIAGTFAGTIFMPLALTVDYNLGFLISNLCQAFLSFNTWLNFRREEDSSVETADHTTWA